MEGPTPESNERISRRFFSMVIDLVKELEAEGDSQGLEVLPTVIMSTGLMTMCRSLGIDTTLGVLDALKIKVERGDFTIPDNEVPN
ncbi:MAG: hypothetical protein LBV79_02235 [Candidatus Adiutrix sp.]|jgi:hypothetical protein|nr:hypothetical protein [Candidatus Adiutrix sp.]